MLFRSNRRSRNQRPDRNQQSQSGRSVPLAGAPFRRLRNAVGRSNEPRLRRSSQSAPRKLQNKRPLPRNLRKRLRRERRRRLRPKHPDRPPQRKLLLSKHPLRPTFPGSGGANGVGIGLAPPFHGGRTWWWPLLRGEVPSPKRTTGYSRGERGATLC